MLAAITFKNTPISVPTPSQNNPPTRQAVTGKQGAATWQWGGGPTWTKLLVPF